jgi:hypothetical protein
MLRPSVAQHQPDAEATANPEDEKFCSRVIDVRIRSKRGGQYNGPDRVLAQLAGQKDSL